MGLAAQSSSAVIVGAGHVGGRAALRLREAGWPGVVVEAGRALLGRAVPAFVAARVQALHEARGVAVRVGVKPVAIERDGDALRVRLEEGDAIDADTIVVGIGITPNAELAAETGLL